MEQKDIMMLKGIFASRDDLEELRERQAETRTAVAVIERSLSNIETQLEGIKGNMGKAVYAVFALVIFALLERVVSWIIR